MIIGAFIHVTNSCNLKCFHCAYASSQYSKDNLSFNKIEGIAEFLVENGAKSIMIGGGEPLLRPDIIDILDMLFSYNLSVKLGTNLTADDDIIKQLAGFPNISITTSIDSMNSEIHDRQRGKIGCFKKTYKNVLYLRNEGIPVTVNALMLKSNKNDIDQYLDFSLTTGTVFRPLFRVINLGRSAISGVSKLSLDAFEIKSILDKMIIFCDNENNRKLVTFYLPPALIPVKYIETPCICSWGNFIGIAADGTIALCPAAKNLKEFTGGNIEYLLDGQIKYKDIPFVELSSRFNPDELTGVCRKCVVRDKCKGGCRVDAYVNYGSSLSSDPICEAFYNSGLFPEYALDS